MDDHPMESAVQVLLPLLSAHPPSYPPSKMFSQQPYDAARVVGIIALTSKALRSRLQKDSDLVALVADHLMPGWTIWKLPNEVSCQEMAITRVHAGRSPDEPAAGLRHGSHWPRSVSVASIARLRVRTALRTQEHVFGTASGHALDVSRRCVPATAPSAAVALVSMPAACC